MVLAFGVGGTGDDSADETKALVVGERLACDAYQSVLAGAAGTDHENEHCVTPLTGRTLALAWPEINL